MRFFLVPDDDPERHEVRLPGISIGRDPDNDVPVRDDFSTVSRRHAFVQRVGDAVVIEDLNSANGTFVNGKRVQRLRLEHGDEIQLGDRYRIRVESESESTPTTTIDAPGNPVLRIGRSPGNDIVLPSPAVSWHHAELRRQQSVAEIIDLRSTNGTFLNGESVKRSRLSPGDRIVVGTHHFTFHDDTLQELTASGALHIRGSGLSKVVGRGQTILHAIDVDIAPRAFVAIVGPSGSGKSTLLNILSGSSVPSTGDVMIEGRSLYTHYAEFRAHLGVVPQDDIIHTSLSVETALDFGARLRFPDDTTDEERRYHVERVLGQLGLAEHASKRVDVLSGGQRKRVSIGMELLTEPDLLFLDEPTSGLDPGIEGQMMRLFRELADGGRSVVLVTHATRNIAVCDRVVFLGPGGYLVYQGAPPEALQYFEVDEFEEIYDLVSTVDGAERWVERHREEQTAAGRPVITARASERDTRPLPLLGRRSDPVEQTITLAWRYARTLMADRKNLLLLMGQAPVIAAVLNLIYHDALSPRLPPDGLDTGYRSASALLMFLAAASVWFGGFNAAREVCKEASILRREAMVAVRLGPYLASKFIVLGLIVLIQTFLLVSIVNLRNPLPVDIWAGAFVILLLAGLAATALGLTVSALMSNPDRAVSVIPALMLPQIMLSGALTELSGPLEVIAAVVTGRWAYEGLGRVTELNVAFSHDPALMAALEGTPVIPLVALLAHIAAFAGLAYWALSRRARGWQT